jgi:CBS domain containing-hemolysin-like protein
MDDPSSPAVLSAVLAVALARWGATQWLEAIAVAFCVVLMAFVSLAEAAMVSVNKVRLRTLAEDGNARAALVDRLTDDRRLLLAVLVINLNLSIIIISALVTHLTLGAGGGRWVWLSTLITILFLLIFCEVAPKTYSVHRAERVALATAPLIGLLVTVFRPVASVLNAIAGGLLRRLLVPVLGGSVEPTRPAFTEEEIKRLVTAGEAGGELAEEERDMIHGVIEFADTVAREVMVPRTDMVGLEVTASLAEAIELILARGFSRIPVYEENVDHIVGILYVKDVLLRLQGGPPPAAVAEVMRSAYFVPESKKVDELLRTMQANRVHMAIVIDEYGGTAGLVTIEDLLEEIVGEIRDEYELLEREVIHKLDERSAIVDSRVSVDEIEEYFHTQLPAGDFDSLGGLVLEALGRFPERGETVRVGDLELTLEEVSENRIEKIRVVKAPAESPESASP